jgi:hypothetical protein
MNEDGTATCGRCRRNLEGFGVLYGLICTDLDGNGEVVDRIFCYGCRDHILSNMVAYPLIMSPPVCTTCQEVLTTRSVSEAMLATDVNPDGTTRLMAFCYKNGHRDQILSRARL